MLLLISVGTAFAQKKTKQDCTDPLIKSTAENLKNGYVKQGMTLYQETMLDMTSMEPMPIAVRLYEGVDYQLVYVGSEHANKLIFQLFDGKDNKLDEKRERGQDYLIYQFKPTKTDIYLINLYQKKGVKDMCGYFGVMFKANGATQKQTPQVAQQPSYNYNTTPTNNNNYKQPINTTATSTTPRYTAPQRQQQTTNTPQQSYQHTPYNKNNNNNQRNASQEGTYTPPAKSVWQQTQEEKRNGKKQPLKKFSEEPPMPEVAKQEAPQYQAPETPRYQAPARKAEPQKQEAIYQPPPVRYNDANEHTTYRETKTVQEEVIYKSPTPKTTQQTMEQPRYQPSQPIVTETPKQPIRYQRTTTVTNSSNQRTNYQSSKQQREAAQKQQYQQTEPSETNTTTKQPTDPAYPNMPDNQRPNPNRTRATREAMQNK